MHVNAETYDEEKSTDQDRFHSDVKLPWNCEQTRYFITISCWVVYSGGGVLAQLPYLPIGHMARVNLSRPWAAWVVGPRLTVTMWPMGK